MLDRATAMDQAMTAARAAEHWCPKGRSSTKAERFPLCSRGQGRGYARLLPTRTVDTNERWATESAAFVGFEGHHSAPASHRQG